MFSFKARHYLPAFLLASAFPRELWMSSHWQCSALAITLENQESGLLLKFQEPERMPALSRLQKLPVPRSLAPAKPAEGGDRWRTPFSKSHCARGSVVLQLVVLGGTRWGAMRKPHPQSPDGSVAIPFSLLWSRKASKTQQGITAAQKLRVALCKLFSPASWSPLTSRSRANLSEMPGSRHCSLGVKPSDGASFWLCSETGRGWREL